MSEDKLIARILRIVASSYGCGSSQHKTLCARADEFDPPRIEAWMGKRIDDMAVDELRAALRQAADTARPIAIVTVK